MLQEFLNEVIEIQKTGVAREHAYRPALQKLFNSLSENVRAVNEPARVEVGAPDFVFLRGDIPIGHCEAKDLDADLKVMRGYAKDQKKRYTEGFPNLIYTNCLDWRFYRDGECITQITIADLLKGIQPRPERFEALETMLRDFIAQTPQTITSSQRLAERMAGKAILVKDVLANSLMQDKGQETELSGQYLAFKEHLIHDISLEDFADIYAETIAYGMFAARLHDETLEDFSRQEALELLPRSNPFLRNLFGYIAGPNLDFRISWIVDDLAKVFQATDVKKIMERFGNTTQRNDPLLHFYEDFLAAYNPKKREVRGVWYTPEPVVDFIVRAVDDVLKDEFGFAEGLADNRKITVDWDTGQTDNRGRSVTTKKQIHKVQILDPAVGTGTFLAEVIKSIAPRIKATAPGMWQGYVEKELVPRLHGFELLMASYAMCHMKLEMVLREYGYNPKSESERVSVYLTNSLEEGEAANQTLPFAQWLSREVKEANTVKRDLPIMCIIGNPPYRANSTNKGDWILGLLDAYKKEPGGFDRLNERNPKLINDDYVKFIRMSEAMIDKNGEGVLSFVTNHGYLDNPTFRGVRWHLLKTFDKIYVIDLHGNSNRGEVSPDGGSDENVFDIQQGVAIFVGIKTNPTILGDKRKRGKDYPLAKVWHKELWGRRSTKYDSLIASSLGDIDWSELHVQEPFFEFVPRDWELVQSYEAGFTTRDFFELSLSGVVTGNDEKFISMDRNTLQPDSDQIVPIVYRPLDHRFVLYDPSQLQRARHEVMKHMIRGENFAMIMPRQALEGGGCFVSSFVGGHKTYSAYNRNYYFPLYIYPDETELDQSRRINFDHKLYEKLQQLGTSSSHGVPDEVAAFNYIYGVLHCPAYLERYTELLKIDFPRIPWPANPDLFWKVSGKGDELRRLHLMEPGAVGETPFSFVGESDNIVGKLKFEEGRIWINDKQYFDNAPSVSWEFSIGGYKPAQKWLKDRKGRSLNFDDVRHYQRILKVLSETDRLMKEIEMPLESVGNK